MLFLEHFVWVTVHYALDSCPCEIFCAFKPGLNNVLLI